MIVSRIFSINQGDQPDDQVGGGVVLLLKKIGFGEAFEEKVELNILNPLELSKQFVHEVVFG